MDPQRLGDQGRHQEHLQDRLGRQLPVRRHRPQPVRLRAGVQQHDQDRAREPSAQGQDPQGQGRARGRRRLQALRRQQGRRSRQGAGLPEGVEEGEARPEAAEVRLPREARARQASHRQAARQGEGGRPGGDQARRQGWRLAERRASYERLRWTLTSALSTEALVPGVSEASIASKIASAARSFSSVSK
jgi:hypothetical protein